MNYVFIIFLFSFFLTNGLSASEANYLYDSDEDDGFYLKPHDHEQMLTRIALLRDGNTYNPEPTTHNAPLIEAQVMNDYWRAIQKQKNPDIKNNALEKILSLYFPPELYPLERYHIAAALMAGANPNKKNRFSAYPLTTAASQQDYALCQLCLACGADPNINIKDFPCSPPLWLVKTRSLAELLVQHGARIEPNFLIKSVCDASYEPALVKFYRQQGVSAFTKGPFDESALHALVKQTCGSAYIVDYEERIPALLAKVAALFAGLSQEEIVTLINMPLPLVTQNILIPKATLYLLSLEKDSKAAQALTSFLQLHVEMGILDRYLLQKKPVQQTVPQEDALCPICDESPVNITTACGHSFCKPCLTGWLKDNMSCPMCRGRISKKLISSLII